MTTLVETLRALSKEAKVDREATWQRIENARLINHVKVQEYRCSKGCRLAVVIRLGDVVLLRTDDYKLRPRTNEQRSVPTAREKNTLNGSDHWPGHTFDVGESAGQEDPKDWGAPVWGDRFRVDINCKHRLRSLDFVEVLATIRDTQAGHPNKPCILP